MFSNPRTILGALTVLCGLLLVGLFGPFRFVAPSQAQESDYEYIEVVERTFDVQPGQALHLDTDLGSVQVRGTSGSQVVVVVRKGANGVSERQAEEMFERFDLDFQPSGSGVTIKATYEGNRSWRHRNRLHVDYEISVPHAFDVTVKTAGGSLRAEALRGKAVLHTSGGSVAVNDLDGPLDVNTSGGSITAEAIGGRAELQTSGGSITAREVKGSVDANTSGGSITVERASGDVVAHTSGGSIRLTDIYGTANAHTSGGSITAELAVAPDGPMELETSGGGITLRLTPDARVQVDAESSGGSVKTDLPVTVQGERKRDRLHGEINGGGPLMKLRSSGGGIRIYGQ